MTGFTYHWCQPLIDEQRDPANQCRALKNTSAPFVPLRLCVEKKRPQATTRRQAAEIAKKLLFAPFVPLRLCVEKKRPQATTRRQAAEIAKKLLFAPFVPLRLCVEKKRPQATTRRQAAEIAKKLLFAPFVPLRLCVEKKLPQSSPSLHNRKTPREAVPGLSAGFFFAKQERMRIRSRGKGVEALDGSLTISGRASVRLQANWCGHCD